MYVYTHSALELSTCVNRAVSPAWDVRTNLAMYFLRVAEDLRLLLSPHFFLLSPHVPTLLKFTVWLGSGLLGEVKYGFTLEQLRFAHGSGGAGVTSLWCG